jgi:hypothetical protein
MAVNLSPVGGVAAQFFDNAGNVLTGGKLYTYAAGTTTPQTAYTTSAGDVAWSNPIILDAAGRVSGSGEIWLTDGVQYKFILRDSNDVLIATYDNVIGINSNFVNFTNEQEIQTATAGQTVFNLTTTTYAPSTNSLSVFVDGVNQYGPSAQYAYLETDSDTVTFVNGLHVGALVKFTTSQLNSSAGGNAFNVAYLPPYANSVGTTVGDKLAQYISAKDFGAVENGVTDDSAAIINAFTAAQSNPVLTTGSVNANSISAAVGRLQSGNVVFSNRNDGIVGLEDADYPDAQNMTWATGEKFVQSFRNGQSSGNSIYNAIFPSVNHFDALQGIVDIAPGSTIEHAVGVSGYVRNRDSSPTNGVGLFGCGTAEVDGAYVWGINTLIQDSATRAAGTGTGRGLINELDFNVMNPATQVIGLSLGGNSLAQPSGSFGFVVNSLGSGITWEFGFLTIDGSAVNAMKIGAEASTGSSINGQKIVYGYKDSGGVDRTVIQQVNSTGLMVIQATGFALQGGNVFLDNTKALIVNGQQVVTNRQTGWQLPSGTLNRSSFNTTSVTTEELAERVYALITDLYSGHGLIGA